MSSFLFVCPLCEKDVICDDSLENQAVQCPECGGEIVPVRSSGANGRPEQTGRTMPGRSTKNQNTEFKRPILTVVFNAFGIVLLLAGILLCVLGAIDQPLAVIYGAAVAAASVFPFGVAQIVYYIARISYNTERTANLLKWK